MMPHKDAPHMKPKQRRQHATEMTVEILKGEIDVAEVKRELCTPWPRPEVADRVFLRALKAITQLEKKIAELSASPPPS